MKNYNWSDVLQKLDRDGYVLLPQLLDKITCTNIREKYTEETLYRKRVIMERYRFGKGEYKYYDYNLPEVIQEIRTEVYKELVPLANSWMMKLRIEMQYPKNHHDFINICQDANQRKPTPLILKYERGGYNTLHQDLYGDACFPFQLVIALSQIDRDYKGGELVLNEQIPRSQTIPSVLTPNLGDAIIFATNFKPRQGKRGFYRTQMKHGVSKIHQGERYTLGIIFHDAIS